MFGLGRVLEDQERANERIPVLLKYPAIYRFLSCEPLLGLVDLSEWTHRLPEGLNRIDWVITGGESGPSARAMLRVGQGNCAINVNRQRFLFISNSGDIGHRFPHQNVRIRWCTNFGMK